MSVSSLLARGRRAAERLMVDECVIRRRTGEETTDGYGNITRATVGVDCRLRGSRLFRKCGWSTDPLELFEVTVVYTHGYPPGAQELQLGRSAVLGLIRDVPDNPTGLKSESLDDWSATYAAMSALMEGTPALRTALRRQYGRRR